MQLFDEFFMIMQVFEKSHIAYTVIGGIALAFYDQPRFTRDIDILIDPDDLEKVSVCLEKLEYHPSVKPFTFNKVALRLHRFTKIVGPDHMTVDILVSTDNDARFRHIIENSNDEASQYGTVKIAGKNDLIWLKQIRNSEQDQVDIGKLQNDAN